MRNTSNRVTRATVELRALSSELHWSNFENSSRAEQNQILNGLMNGGLAEDLKTTLDHLRHFLWCYIESAAVAGGEGTDYAVQSARLQRVTDMLRLLRSPAYCSQEPTALLEQITQSVDRKLEIHQPREIAWKRSA